MDEGENKLRGTERKTFIEQVAKNPIPTLRTNIAKGKSCAECVEFLHQVRTELTTMLTGERAYEAHPAFAQFVKLGNGNVEHYVGLFSMLKDVGFSRTDIAATFMDNMPIGKKQDAAFGEPAKMDTTKRSEIVGQYLALTTSALDTVFGPAER